MVQLQPDPPTGPGAIAQLGERLLCKQEVTGSIPVGSTRLGVRSGVRGQGPSKSYRLRTTAFKRGDWGKAAVARVESCAVL